MARILHFDKLFKRRELEEIEKLFAPVKLRERRPSASEPKIKLSLKRTTEPPKAA
jgi:hypothetical protein